MKPLLYSILIACCLAFTLSCSNPKSGSNSNDSLSELDKEARAEFEKLFERHFTQCGDSYYSELTEVYESDKRKSILRWEGVSFIPFPSVISENENRKKFQWRGGVQLHYKADRQFIIYDSKNNPTGWQEWGRKTSIAPGSILKLERKQYGTEIEKRDSKWTLPTTLNYEQKRSDHPNSEIYQSEIYKKVDCNSIPQ